MTGAPVRVCIIGNSHIAALKLAIRHGFFRDDRLDVVFWGVTGTTGNGFRSIRYENGRLVTTETAFVRMVSEGKYETINPDDFNALIFHGSTVRYTKLLDSLRRTGGDVRQYSRAFLRDGIAGWLGTSHAATLIHRIRSSYTGRILVSPMPLMSEDSKRFDGRTVEAGELTLLNDILSEFYAAGGAEFLPQPNETIVQNKYTSTDFSIGSVPLGGDVRHRKAEYYHMNARYGEAVLRKVSERLQS